MVLIIFLKDIEGLEENQGPRVQSIVKKFPYLINILFYRECTGRKDSPSRG